MQIEAKIQFEPWELDYLETHSEFGYDEVERIKKNGVSQEQIISFCSIFGTRDAQMFQLGYWAAERALKGRRNAR